MRLFLALFLMGASFLEGAPRRYDDDLSIQIREMRDSLDYLRREVTHHEEEIRTFEQKTLTQEDVLDTLRKEAKETQLSHKQHSKNHQEQLETKLASFESAQKSITVDLKQLKVNSNETQELLKTYRDKISGLEKTVESLTRNLHSMQSAVNSLVEMMKEPSTNTLETVNKLYKVKAGDTLEKIARASGTTIKTIKELNNLTKDQIVIGQTLKLAE